MLEVAYRDTFPRIKWKLEAKLFTKFDIRKRDRAQKTRDQDW